MPSIFEYWTTMAYSTCNNYLKRYTDVAALKAGIRRHASTNGVQINLREDIGDIARFRQGIPRQKRPIAKNISEAPPPKRARIADIRIENAQIEELQAAVVDTPPVVVVDAPPAIAIAVNNDSPVIVVVDAPPTIAINGARKPLVLNGITIEVDPQTLMVNATQMCRAAGKLFGNYRRLDSTEDFLQELSSNIHICIFELVKCNPGHNGGTWVDWRVALHLAQWLSPAVQVQVTGWIGELMLTGRVELGNEMSPQQLDEAWQQRVIDAQRLQKDAEDRLAGAIEETRKELIAKASEERELAVQKTREELMATVQALVRDTEQLPQFPDGANVLYAAYIDNGLIKYGQSSNFIRRLADHQRHYPEFLLIKALLCDNAVAAEKKLRDFVAKKRIGAEFRGEKEIIGFKTQEDIYLLIKAMQKSCRNRSSDNAVELKRIEANVTIQLKKMELLMQDKITFEQYLLMK